MASRLDRIMDWENLARKAGYCVDQLACTTGVSTRQLERYFSNASGLSPKAWLDQLRMADGQRLLQRGKLIKEVAQQIGFRYPQHFARAFKRIHAANPGNSRRPDRPDLGGKP